MNALSEINMTSLAKMSQRLSVALQVKWRDEAKRFIQNGGFPSLKELVEFIERQAEAANDPIFGKVGEVNRNVAKRPVKGNRRAPPSGLTAEDGPRVMTFATQLGSYIKECQKTQSKGPNVSKRRVTPPAGKCYSCEASHEIEHCPDFTSKSVRQRMIFARYKGLCLNCLQRGHFAGECKSVFQCRHCQQAHHTLLHKSVEEPANVSAATIVAGDEMPSRIYSATSKARVASQVLLIELLSKEGNSISTYILLDTGSEETFLCKSMA